MNSLTFFFIAFQLMDFVTTFTGFSIGLSEFVYTSYYKIGLPILLIKVLFIIIGSIVIQRKKLWKSKFSWTIPIFSAFIVLWNSYNILLVI